MLLLFFRSAQAEVETPVISRAFPALVSGVMRTMMRSFMS